MASIGVRTFMSRFLISSIIAKVCVVCKSIAEAQLVAVRLNGFRHIVIMTLV